MKATIISMFIVIGLMVAVPMIVMEDKQLMSELFGSGGDSGKESIASLKAKAPRNINTVTVRNDVTMYKWVDEQGVLQYSQTPPPGMEVEEMTLKPNLNTMERPYMPVEEEQAPAAGAGGFTPGNPYNPSNLNDMMRQAKDLQKQLNQQMKDRQSAMDKMMK